MTYLKAKAFRGKINLFQREDKWGDGLFLTLFDYTVEKDQRLHAIIKTIPQNATYTSHDMQNKLIAVMSSVATKGIRQEIRNSWYIIKVDGTKDPTVVENISIFVF